MVSEGITQGEHFGWGDDEADLFARSVMAVTIMKTNAAGG